MFLGDLVKYQGAIYTVTSTYKDGTVDLVYSFNVKRNEVKLV